jgi:hypothetical protein
MIQTRQTVAWMAQVAKLRVATISRFTLPLAVLVLASAHAAPAQADEADVRNEPDSYALPLGLAYVLAPGLALAAGGGLSELEVDDGFAVLGGAVMFTLPAGAHLYNGRAEQAGISLASMVGITAGGFLVGGILGWVIGSRGCEGNSDSDECNRRLETTPVGAAIGGTLGYVGHAIWDVAAHSDVPTAADAPKRAEPLLWFYPTLSSSDRDAEGRTKLDGFQAGVSLSL